MKPYSTEPIPVPRFEEKNGFYTTINRSAAMSKIRAKETKPEIAFRKALFAKGYRYRKNVKDLPGRPDIVIKKYKLAIFVDGSFWHGKDWEIQKTKLKTNTGFWIPKIERNIQRDGENETALRNLGFTVLRFWDTDLGPKRMLECVERIASVIETAKLKRSREIPVIPYLGTK